MKSLIRQTRRGPDRRVEKTRKQLHEALISLLHEKSYTEIAMKEILDRANVGRSTFYVHFHDKNDLLVSGMMDVLAVFRSKKMPPSAKGAERILWFSLPLFEHIAEQRSKHRHTSKAKLGDYGRAVHHEYLQKALVETIAMHMKVDPEIRRGVRNAIPPELLVRHMASTFILVLNWWIECRSTLDPKQVDEIFRTLIEPALAAR